MEKKKITPEEYSKAYEIIQRYEYQQKKTIQVTVTYDASVTATIQVPDNWSSDEIKENLKRGYYGFELDDQPYTRLSGITELIVNGVVIK